MKFKVIGIIVGCSLIFAFLPLIGWFIGMQMNEIWDCGVQGESGIPTGTCPTWQSDLVSLLMISMWLLFVTFPIGMVAAAVALIVLAVMAMRSKMKRVKQP